MSIYNSSRYNEYRALLLEQIMVNSRLTVVYANLNIALSNKMDGVSDVDTIFSLNESLIKVYSDLCDNLNKQIAWFKEEKIAK